MNRERVRIVVRGAVQGVGFRPFVFRLAMELQLHGWVSNSSQGVFIEAEGPSAATQQFLMRLEKEKPSRAVIHTLESSFLDPIGYDTFEIRESEERGEKTAVILPDIATCCDCLNEILDSANRRFHYPFTNCTNCGPRFSIIESLPYDRANTSMREFAMCAECDREYGDPLNRRFHAQPNACPRCGPQLEFWESDGRIVARGDDALGHAIGAINTGKILALKGLGGFHLVTDAADEGALGQLRKRKHREEKPFAVMFPTLQAIRRDCEVTELEERLLLSPESPIVLVRKQNTSPSARIAHSVAPGNPNLGVMLPYTPLHHLLMGSLDAPIVATSGNLSDEPICIDEHDALRRLRGIADVFLVHNRSIVRHVDDSIVRIMAGREMVLRRARGYAPLPVRLPQATTPILALGAHLKNTVALGIDASAFISQHIGDLETEEAYSAFLGSSRDLPRLYESTPETIACDLHPDYLSTKYATEFSVPIRKVQHHWAHVAACMAENDLSPPLLGVSWDGTGYGGDGTIWGGEFLFVDANGVTRFAHLRHFRLPGGEAAVREPRRTALGILYEIFGYQLWQHSELLHDFDKAELKLLQPMMLRTVNSPATSSAGRLFDAVAALVGLRPRASFEGQAAMDLEFACQSGIETSYGFQLHGRLPIVVDWQAAILEILHDLRREEDAGTISAKFHNTLVEMIITIARKCNQEKVVLTGGCFQNRYLTERAIDRLFAEGFRPYWHQRIPPNDGGISLGQIFASVNPLSLHPE